MEKSLGDYNSAIQNQTDDPLSRTHRPLPVSTAPFYAIRSQSWTLKSYAGLAVNENLQVVSGDGKPIGNLYAAGEVLGAATSGKSHTGGGSVTPAIAFGRMLGEPPSTHCNGHAVG
jgi:fumarate reductase flavoprotein subunit